MHLDIVIPMAGAGSRFEKAGYKIPKYMIEAKGRTLFNYSLYSLPFDIADKIIFIALEEHERDFYLSKFLEQELKLLGIAKEKVKVKFIPQITRGQSETVLKAKELIDDDDEILIYNIDTFFYSNNLKEKLLNKTEKLDGLFGVFELNGKDDKWSFAKVDTNGNIVETAEKKQISNYASTGLYHFSKAKDFFNVAENRINKGLIEAKEFYIAPLYNDLIKQGKKFKLDIVNQFTPLGTPTDVEIFINN